jgi:hypothetical protein
MLIFFTLDPIQPGLVTAHGALPLSFTARAISRAGFVFVRLVVVQVGIFEIADVQSTKHVAYFKENPTTHRIEST